MFHDIKSLLKNSLKQKKIHEAVTAVQVVAAFRSLVAEMFGESTGQGLRQVTLKGDVLQIAAGSPALASELRLRQTELSRLLAQKLPSQNISLKIFG